MGAHRSLNSSGRVCGLLLADAEIDLVFPMRLRMTRLHDGSFLCYANGTQLSFSDPSVPPDEPYEYGGIGLRVESGTATFDDVAVHGGTNFLDPNTGMEEEVIDDPFYRLNLDGTPFMWGLLGSDSPPSPGESKWVVVKDDSDHGKVLQGTASINGTLALRGDRSWISDDPLEYMNYSIQADVKLLSANGQAGVCVRVNAHPDGHGYWFYELHLDAAEEKLKFRRRHYSGQYGWIWEEHPYWNWGPVSNPTGWHTIEVKAIGNSFDCYLDGEYKLTATDASGYYPSGLIGLSVDSEPALFNNVKVLDLRE